MIFLNCILLLQLNTIVKAIIPGTRVIAEIKQNIILQHIQVIRLNINFDEILRRMKRRGALDEAKVNEYKDTTIDPEWHRILAFLYDVVNEFSWTQFLTFKNVLKKVNRNLFLVVFKDRECDETLLRCISTPTL